MLCGGTRSEDLVEILDGVKGTKGGTNHDGWSIKKSCNCKASIYVVARMCCDGSIVELRTSVRGIYCSHGFDTRHKRR